MTDTDLPAWAYWLLVPVVAGLVILYAVLSSDYRPRHTKNRPKKKK